MATTPIIHVFKEINVGRYATVRHFQLYETFNGSPQLSTLLNISVNRNYALSMPKYWVKERGNNGWVKPHLTGLFPFGTENLFWGDANRKKHLLLFSFDQCENQMIVFYFKNQYSNDFRGFVDIAIRLYHKQKRMV